MEELVREVGPMLRSGSGGAVLQDAVLGTGPARESSAKTKKLYGRLKSMARLAVYMRESG